MKPFGGTYLNTGLPFLPTVFGSFCFFLAIMTTALRLGIAAAEIPEPEPNIGSQYSAMQGKSRPKVPRRTLYVGGLEETVTEELVHAAFIPFGDLVEVQMPRDWKAGTNRGFAFVEFEEEEDAAAAMVNMDGSELAGRVLKVNQAKALKHKLGNVKAVWSADEWFKDMQEGDDMINLTADDLPTADSLKPQGA